LRACERSTGHHMLPRSAAVISLCRLIQTSSFTVAQDEQF
jgi:hypothetical protein